MKTKRTLFDRTSVLLLGLLALLWMGAAPGCGKDGVSSGMRPPSSQAGTAAQPTASPSPFVLWKGERISQLFFENPLLVTVRVTDVSGKELGSIADSPVSWKYLPPEGPPPQPGAIADYRDRPGCAFIDEARASSAICFIMAPDVSSVDVNEDHTRLKSPEALPGLRGCGEAVFAKVDRPDSKSLHVEYRLNCPAGPVTLSYLLRSRP